MALGQVEAGVCCAGFDWLAVLVVGVVLFELVRRALIETQNPNFVPSLILLGAAVMPATFLTFLVGRRLPADVPGIALAVIALLGGVMGTVVASTPRRALARDDAVRNPSARRTEPLFRAALLVKGVDGAAELVGAVALLAVSGATVHRLGADVLSRDLLGAPGGSLARHFAAGTSEFASRHRTFAVVYLGLHGVVKLALVAALLRRWLPAFPIAVVLLGAFVIYEIYRATRRLGAAAVPCRQLGQQLTGPCGSQFKRSSSHGRSTQLALLSSELVMTLRRCHVLSHLGRQPMQLVP